MSLLSGIRVLDLSLQLPGPFCTLMMADYGADVVKVDEPFPRMRNPFAGEKPGLSPTDRYLNRGKRSLTLNLKSPEGKEIFGALAESADVVVEGFRPGVTARLGVDYATLSARNPRLVYCSISGFGQAGPMRDVAGHDINYISYAGILGLCGPRDGPPALPAVQIGDLFGGAMMALSGILMALLSRQATGVGRLVDVSMTDGAFAMFSLHAASYLAGGEEPRRGEMILTGRYPCYDVYRCSDGEYVSLGALEPWFWKGFVEAIGREDLAGLQYAAGEEGERVRADLRKLFGSKSREEWVRFFDGKDICFSPVLSLSEAVSHPNVKERDMVIEVGSPLGGRERQPGLPIKFPGTAAAPRRSPFLGEHDEEILKDLGFTAQRVEELRKKGVIRGE
ncbi:MAG: CaiB/BaiF CoA transferase family protein [Deltaproteobacteria bacterium]|nr:CaiB/BaiF CoA-transferase family protein [Candidatus Deferrimicrobiaceae bacterium]